MIIKEYRQLRYSSGPRDFFPVYPQLQTSLSLIIMFFHDALARIQRGGELHTIDNLNNMLQHGMGFETVTLSVDHRNNLIYINQVDYDTEAPNDEIARLLEEENDIALCQLGFYKHLILTKKNFIHLVLAWQAASNNQSPFLLLYQDEHNWYGIVPFDSQKAMEEFIISNTKTLLKK